MAISQRSEFRGNPGQVLTNKAGGAPKYRKTSVWSDRRSIFRPEISIRGIPQSSQPLRTQHSRRMQEGEKTSV